MISNYGYLIMALRYILFSTSIENGMRFQSLDINGKPLLRRYSPAPSTIETCACSVNFDCPDTAWSGGPFLCQNGDNCTPNTTVWSVTGFVRTCNAFESILGSDLRCFFNQTCFNTILSMYNVDLPDRLPLPSDTLAITVLNSSVQSRFTPTTTLNYILNQLAIEEWQTTFHFENFFNACIPITCSYRRSVRMEILYVVSVVVSIVGGLVTILRLVVPYAVWFIYHVVKLVRSKRSNRPVRMINIINGIVSSLLSLEKHLTLKYS